MTTRTDIDTADVVALAPAPDADRLLVLLIRRAWPPFQGRLALPGGYLDPGETPVEAAVRELAEETGLQVDQGDLHRITRLDTPGRDPRGPVVSEAHLVLLDAPVAPVAADDAAEAGWHFLTDVLADPGLLAFDHHHALTEALCLAATLQD